VTVANRRRAAGSGGSRRPGTLARATAYIDARHGLGLTIDDVAGAAGVTCRALQLTFRRHLGLTPTAYMRQVRLARAHRELEQAVPGDGTTVTRIALDWGFASPSRFAAYYRSTYGRPPHETLRS